MEKMEAETLRQECARLEVRFDGEFAGLFWFADSKEGELSYGAGTVELNHENCRHRTAEGPMTERSPRRDSNWTPS